MTCSPSLMMEVVEMGTLFLSALLAKQTFKPAEVHDVHELHEIQKAKQDLV